MPTQDQVAWANCNVTVGGDTSPFGRGSLLPEPTSPEEAAERSTLRLIGAIRTVEVVYTPEELAEQARQRGQASAAREAALDVDPALPLSQQVPGTAEPGLPTMVEPSGSPVVIGDEDLRAEHEQAQAAAEQRAAQARSRPPGAGASKAAWVDYAVEQHGADRDQAGQLSRDQLVSRYQRTGQEELMQTSQGRAAQDPSASQQGGQQASQAAGGAGPDQAQPATDQAGQAQPAQGSQPGQAPAGQAQPAQQRGTPRRSGS